MNRFAIPLRRRVAVAALVFGGVLFAPRLARAHEGPGGNLGVGLGVGAPTGVSVELSALPEHAFELALGLNMLDLGAGYGHLVYKASVARLSIGPTVRVPFYLGAGAFVLNHDRDADIGLRMPVGVNFDFQHTPIQAFAEVALSATVIGLGTTTNRAGWLGMGGYAGARWWF